MANLFGSTVSKLFGSKSNKDLKLVEPYVDLINAEYEKLQGISNDELRANTDVFRKRVDDHLVDINKQIDDLNKKVKEAVQLTIMC